MQKTADQLPFVQKPAQMETLQTEIPSKTEMEGQKDMLKLNTVPSYHSIDNLKKEDKTEDYRESPIRAPIAKQILEEKLYSRIETMKKVLEFRRKKVVKAELKRYYQLFQQQNNIPSQEIIEVKLPTSNVIVPKPQESELVKKIRKSAIVRKLNNFWCSKTSQYPTVFKKLYFMKRNNISGRFLLEKHDLTKHQFDSKTGNSFDDSIN